MNALTLSIDGDISTYVVNAFRPALSQLMPKEDLEKLEAQFADGHHRRKATVNVKSSMVDAVAGFANKYVGMVMKVQKAMEEAMSPEAIQEMVSHLDDLNKADISTCISRIDDVSDELTLGYADKTAKAA